MKNVADENGMGKIGQMDAQTYKVWSIDTEGAFWEMIRKKWRYLNKMQTNTCSCACPCNTSSVSWNLQQKDKSDVTLQQWFHSDLWDRWHQYFLETIHDMFWVPRRWYLGWHQHYLEHSLLWVLLSNVSPSLCCFWSCANVHVTQIKFLATRPKIWWIWWMVGI